MTEKEARQYFNREARYFERGLPPNREDKYAVHFHDETLAAPEPDVLWDKFWALAQQKVVK